MTPHNANPADIKLVTLNNFYANLQNPKAFELFVGMMQMRASGYGRFYSPHFLPLDRSDFIASHYLFCAAEGNELIPQAGFKEVSLDLCDTYGVSFPILGWLRRTGVSEHRRAIENMIDEYRHSGRPLVYGGHVAIRKNARPRTLPRLLRELIAALVYINWKEQGSFAEITVSVLRTQTYIWFGELGFKPLHWAGRPLTVIPHVESPKDSVLFMEMHEPSDWTRHCYEKHKPLIDSRILITP
jgi:hypothetical protein